MTYFLFLDDTRKKSDVKFPEEVELLPCIIAKTYEDFVHIVEENGLPTVVSFDSDLHPTHYQEGQRHNFKFFDFGRVSVKTGYHCSLWLIEYCKKRKTKLPKWFVHSMNTYCRKLIHDTLTEYERDS